VSDAGGVPRDGRPPDSRAESRRDEADDEAGCGLAPPGRFTRLVRRSARYEAAERLWLATGSSVLSPGRRHRRGGGEANRTDRWTCSWAREASPSSRKSAPWTGHGWTWQPVCGDLAQRVVIQGERQRQLVV